MATAPGIFGERFTHRLEAFSDLVFGFSLSLLATRLDIPADPSQIFEPKRWVTFIITFAVICSFWLAHYKIFRHHFVPQIPDVFVNFIFLLGIAVLPYALQTYLRFAGAHDALLLYFGDCTLVFAALATLRLRALLQRRGDSDPELRLREWRSTVRQYAIALVVGGCLIALGLGAILTDRFLTTGAGVFFAVMLVSRFTVKRLPRFLQ